MKKKKSNKLNLIICAIAFVFMIFYVYFVDGFDNLVNSIQKINVGFLLIAMGLMIVYWLLEALGVHAALRATYPKAKFSRTFMTTLLGQYHSVVNGRSAYAGVLLHEVRRSYVTRNDISAEQIHNVSVCADRLFRCGAYSPFQ